MVCLLALAFSACTLTEDGAYARAERQNTTEGYRSFLAKYPRGKYSGTATEILMHREKEDFELAQSRGTEASYRGFLRLWPEGDYKLRAQEGIDDLRFAGAGKRKTIDGYRSYLEKNPNGRHTAQARELLEPLLWNACQGGRRRTAVANMPGSSR
jgi:hypothetical protein